jgi:hypothetical protein
MAYQDAIGTFTRLGRGGLSRLARPLPRLISRLLPPLLSLFVLGACTALPTQQFSTYRDTFAKAQAAGEDVLLDYAAARTRLADIDAARQSSRSTEPQRLSKVPASATTAQAVDHVTVRMRAWNVVARFNDALVAVGEGRSVTEVAAASDALLQSLNTFPIDAVKELGADLVPFAGTISAVLAAAEREVSRQAYLQALAKYSPVVREQFIGLLKKDVDDFYQVRFGLNDREYLQIVIDDIGGGIKRFRELAERSQYTPEVQAVAAAINGALGGLPASAEKTALVAEFRNVTAALAKAPAGAAAPDALTLDKLQRIRDEIVQDAQRGLAKNTELVPYGEVLSSYRTLLDRTARTLKAAEDSVTSGARREPPSDELLNAVVLLRQSYLKYRDHR